MEENLLKINPLQEGNKQLYEIKIAKIPTPGKILIVAFAIGIILFLIAAFVFFPSLPIFFKIGIPVMLVFVFALIFFAGSQIKNMALVLSKQGNKLYVKKVFSKNHVTDKTISLSQNPKLVLVKFPISVFYYHLFLRNGNNLEALIPVDWDVVGKFPLIHPRMKKFLYTQKDAKEISRLLNIPLEISNKNFHEYLSDFKK